MTSLIVLAARCVVAVCAEIIHHLDPDETDHFTDEVFGPRIKWGGNAPMWTSELIDAYNDETRPE